MELVTGGAGFIGSHLVDSLVANGKSVRVLDNFSSGRMEFLTHHDDSGLVEVVKADLLDNSAVRQAMVGVEVVHHMAANPDIRLGTTVTDTDLKTLLYALPCIRPVLELTRSRSRDFA